MDTSRPDAGAHASPAVLVIGGGLLGCAISYYLARAGVDVMLVEKRQLNSQASDAMPAACTSSLSTA